MIATSLAPTILATAVGAAPSLFTASPSVAHPWDKVSELPQITTLADTANNDESFNTLRGLPDDISILLPRDEESIPRSDTEARNRYPSEGGLDFWTIVASVAVTGVGLGVCGYMGWVVHDEWKKRRIDKALRAATQAQASGDNTSRTRPTPRLWSTVSGLRLWPGSRHRRSETETHDTELGIVPAPSPSGPYTQLSS